MTTTNKFDFTVFTKWCHDELGTDNYNEVVSVYRRCLKMAPKILSPCCYDVFVGISRGENQTAIAKRLGVNKSTVCRAWQRARRQLRAAALVISSSDFNEV